MAEQIRIAAAVPQRDVRLDVTVTAGECLAVVGPNGAGKSTLIQLLSGELFAYEGEVRVGEQLLSSPRRHVPPHRRRCSLLGQNPLLFPHLSVLDNVAFGPTSRGVPKRAARARARQELERVGLAGLASRRPRALSGGQAQRVALARALAIDPEVLLLDEPFAALDAAVTPELRAMLREHIRGLTTVMVTHELLDVVTLADTVVELGRGRVVGHGPVTELFRRPGTPFLARFLDVNLVEGRTLGEDGIEWADGVVLRGLSSDPLGDGRARGSFAPRAVSLFPSPPTGSPRNVWWCRVVGAQDHGAVQRVELAVGDVRFHADVTAEALRELDLVPGAGVYAAVKASEVALHPVG